MTLFTPWGENYLCVKHLTLRSLETVDMYEACLRVPSGHSLSWGIQIDTEIIALTGIPVNLDYTVGRATMYIGTEGLGKTTSVKMGKMLDVAAMHPE